MPLCAAVVYAGGWVFALGLGVVAGIGYWEYASLFRSRGVRPLSVLGALGAGAFPLVFLYFGLTGAWILTVVLLALYAAIGMMRVPVGQGPATAAAITAFGALYVGGLISFGVPLREVDLLGRGTTAAGLAPDRISATLLFFFPVVITWLADTAAYFAGKTLGRTRLAPHVSPNKTVEGAVAAVLAGPVVAVLYDIWVLPVPLDMRPSQAMVFGLLIAVAAIFGDLVESALKREVDVKDASGLLPGHGGLLDRLDSLIWTLPTAYFFFIW